MFRSRDARRLAPALIPEAPPQRHVTAASADSARAEGESPGRGLPGAMSEG